MNKYLFIILLSFSSISYSYEGASPEKITLTIGKSIEIDIPLNEEIHLSRKGILNLHHIKETKWRMTAIKIGFVIVTFKNQNQLFIEVLSKKSSIKGAIGFPQWICNLKRFSCNLKTQTISGNIHDPHDFNFAYKTCHRFARCNFKAKLTHKAINRIKIKLKESLSPSYQSYINPTGQILISLPCGEDKLEALKKNTKTIILSYFKWEQLSFICKNMHSKKFYILKAKIFLTEDSTAKELGFFSYIGSSIYHTKGSFNFVSKGQLKALIKEKKAEIIGTPFMHLIAGVENQVETGGEFNSIKENSKTGLVVDQWKKHGLNLKAKVFPYKEGYSLVEYDYSLTTPSSHNSQNSLQANHAKGKTLIKNNSLTIVSGIDINTTGRKERTIPIISSIPIVGPLFNLLNKDYANTKIYIALQIEERKEK